MESIAPTLNPQDEPPSGSSATTSAARPADIEHVGTDTPMILLGYRCLRREHAALRAREPAAGSAPSVDDVHQMRIATRRLRVALRLFDQMLPRRAVRELRRELRWLARALGAVRDLDVYAGTLRDFVQRGGDQAEQLGGYELHVRRERTVARAELAELLAGERYARFRSSLDALVADAPSAGALRRWQTFSVREGAKRALRKSRKRVLKLGGKLANGATANDLHRLRIRVKRLRYEIEFFAAAYPELAAAAKAAKAMQDVLGAHQDAATAASALKRYQRHLRLEPRAGSAPPAEALGRWRASQRNRADAARRYWPDEWQRFVAAAEAVRPRHL